MEHAKRPLVVHHGSRRYERLVRDLAADPRGIVLVLTEPASARATVKNLAADLGLSIYRIDLAAIISKYIGETEKNLRRVFDQAEESGQTLLFDEADALFGQRTEVSSSHRRFLERLADRPWLSILAAHVGRVDVGKSRSFLRAVVKPGR